MVLFRYWYPHSHKAVPDWCSRPERLPHADAYLVISTANESMQMNVVTNIKEIKEIPQITILRSDHACGLPFCTSYWQRRIGQLGRWIPRVQQEATKCPVFIRLREIEKEEWIARVDKREKSWVQPCSRDTHVTTRCWPLHLGRTKAGESHQQHYPNSWSEPQSLHFTIQLCSLLQKWFSTAVSLSFDDVCWLLLENVCRVEKGRKYKVVQCIFRYTSNSIIYPLLLWHILLQKTPVLRQPTFDRKKQMSTAKNLLY